MDNRKETMHRVVALIVSGVGLLMAGSVLAFWSYVYSLKKRFHYTQSTVEVLLSVNNLGKSIGLPAGLLCEKIGPQWTSFTALFINVLGYLLLYGTTLMQTFYYNKSWLQCIYFFIVGFGSICLYMPCFKTGINNVDPKHRAKAVAILDGCLLSGPIVFSALYGQIFAAGHTYDEQNQDLGGYYLMTMIVFVIVCFLCFMFLKEYPVNTTPTEVSPLIDNGNETANEQPNIQKQPVEDIPLMKLIWCLDFHYLFWAFLFSSGVQAVVQNNQAMYLKSFYLEKYTSVLTTFASAPGICGEIAVGVLSDALINKVPRSTYLVAFNIFQTIILVISTFTSNNIVIFTILDLTIGFGNGLIFCIIPTMLSEYYGMKFFARIWGFLILSFGLWTLFLQGIFGWIYENDINSVGVRDCYGLQCFTWSFIMCSTLSFCAAIFFCAILQRDLDVKKRNLKDQQTELTRTRYN